MKPQKLFWLLLLHLELFVLGTGLFILLFQTPLFRGIDVFFYRGIALLFLAALTTTLIAIVIKEAPSKKIFRVYDVILSGVLIFSINIVFFTHVPVTAERSLSVFILGYMNQDPEEVLSHRQISQALEEKYLQGYRAVDKRLNEQLVSGNIDRQGSGYKITKQGKMLMTIYGFFADLFGLEKRNVSP
jgi:hypothetical protein